MRRTVAEALADARELEVGTAYDAVVDAIDDGTSSRRTPAARSTLSGRRGRRIARQH